MSIEKLSRRQYSIAFIEGDSAISQTTIPLQRFTSECEDDYEWVYACKDCIDEILDLRIGERMEMQFNRDNKDSAGFIKRIH